MESLFPVFAQPDINTRGVGRILDSYTNPRRIVSGLNNCLVFSQPLLCLYGTMPTENVFCCLNIAVHRHTQPYIRHCLDFQSWRFSLIVGCNIQPSSSATNQNAALIIDHQLHFTNSPIIPSQPYITLHSSTQRYIALQNPTYYYTTLHSRTELYAIPHSPVYPDTGLHSPKQPCVIIRDYITRLEHQEHQIQKKLPETLRFK